MEQNITKSKQKDILFSGMQPSGKPTLGNYLGAFRNWNSLQEDYKCIYCIADLHSITTPKEPAQLRKNIKDLFTLYLAIGLDPLKNILFCQSHVPAHAELNWILTCQSYMGELSRMTQFKDKSQKAGANIPTGIFNYPILQTADILLYQTNLVPIGLDQRQHLELARDIANRFNNKYGQTFTVPNMYIPKVGAKIMGLQNPDKKMSKSDNDNENNIIYLLDDLKVIENKIKRSVTDSGSDIIYNDDKKGISNLLSIYSTITNNSIEKSEKYFEGFGYGAFKQAVADVVVEEFRPLQQRFNELLKNEDYINEAMKNGANRANDIAFKTLKEVKKKVGFI